MKNRRIDAAVAAVRARVARNGYAIMHDAPSGSKRAAHKLFIIDCYLIKQGYWIQSVNGLHVIRERG